MKRPTPDKRRIFLAALVSVACLAMPAHAQFLKDLQSTIKRNVQSEVHQKVAKESRSVTRCALGEKDDCPALPSGSEQGAVKALENCTPMTFETQHPMLTDFTIEHQIKGMENGRCVYEQSMPSNMKMICNFTREGRMEAAADLREALETGRYQGDMQTMPDFAKECEIEMANGYRVPAGGMTSSGQ